MNRAKWLATLWTLLILIVCWMPRQTLPISETAPSLLRLLQVDKMIHAAIFAGYAYLWRRATSHRAVALIAISGVALGVLTELGQATSFVGRDANVLDGIADSVGVAIGLGVAAVKLSRPIDVNLTVSEPFEGARRESA